jgi:hypothetical protein
VLCNFEGSNYDLKRCYDDILSPFCEPVLPFPVDVGRQFCKDFPATAELAGCQSSDNAGGSGDVCCASSPIPSPGAPPTPTTELCSPTFVPVSISAATTADSLNKQDSESKSTSTGGKVVIVTAVVGSAVAAAATILVLVALVHLRRNEEEGDAEGEDELRNHSEMVVDSNISREVDGNV